MKEQNWNYVIVACARWEEDYIEEWLVYYKSIGVDHIFLYCNDDDPRDLYEAILPFVVGSMPFVTFTHYPYAGAQTQMYKDFLKKHAHKTKWFSFFDIDEFLALKKFTNTNELIQNFQDRADIVYLNWLYFGNSGHIDRPKGRVLTNYTLRAEQANPYTKLIIKYNEEDIKKVITDGESGFWHKWIAADNPMRKHLNILGDDMGNYYNSFPKSALNYLSANDNDKKIAELTCIYHYAFRSEKDLERRIKRGTAGDFKGQVVFQNVIDSGNLKNFLKKFSAVEDTSLKIYLESLLNHATKSSINKRPKSKNIALGKSANQSSYSKWSKGQSTTEDASLVVSGVYSNTYNCHTEHEKNPWWQVDLEQVSAIRKIIIFNRIDRELYRGKIKGFILDTSIDMVTWKILYHDDQNLDFGGTDGNPFTWESQEAVYARFVRIRLPREGFIHLNAVEIYENTY